MKFATKLLLVVLSISMISKIAVAVISYNELMNLSGFSQDINTHLGFFASGSSRNALIEQAESYLERLSAAQAADCNSTLERIQSETTAMAGYITALYNNPDNFRGRALPLPHEVEDGALSAKMLVAPDVEITPEIGREMLLISNAEYMFANILANNTNLDNTYLGTATGINFRFSPYASFNPDFDVRVRPWFMAGMESEGAIWLDTYVDAFGSLATTCAHYFNDASGAKAGVVAIDIMLDVMVENILSMRIGETGYAFLLDERGYYLAHPNYENYESDISAISAASDRYKEILELMAAGGSGVSVARIGEVDFYVAYAPLPVAGWSLGIVVETDEVISGAVMMKEDIDRQALEAREEIRERLNAMMFRFIVLLCVSLVVVLVISILISGTVTRPISKLTDGVIAVGGGNLDAKIEINTKDEIGVLAGAFNKMTGDLREYIENLAHITAEKERISTELNVAAKIQGDMLPKIFPPYPEREEFDIRATMQPAREVGGDFYDFLLIDENRLGIVMADVSGKGVPAALFMVIAKTLINNRARNNEMPEVAFTNINNQLCEGNDASMFVTAWFGVLEIDTGKLTYINAGHNPPLLKKSSGKFEFIREEPDVALAVFEDMTYTRREARLAPGDTLFLYTDGVTEAENDIPELYGEERLKNILDASAELPLAELLSAVRDDVALFANGEPQSDDVTMLAVRMN